MTEDSKIENKPPAETAETHNECLWKEFVESKLWPDVNIALQTMAVVVSKIRSTVLEVDSRPDSALIKRWTGELTEARMALLERLQFYKTILAEGYGPIVLTMFSLLFHDIPKEFVAPETSMYLIASDLKRGNSISTAVCDYLARLQVKLPDLVEKLHRRLSTMMEDKKADLDFYDRTHRRESGVPFSGVLTEPAESVIERLSPDKSKLFEVVVKVKQDDEDIQLPHEHILQEIIRELTVNAVRAMEEKGGVIWLGVIRDNGLLIIAVTDTGHGIPQNKVEQVFAYNYTTKTNDIDGRGLAFNRMAVEEIFHGRLDVISEVNKGTTFFISIPIDYSPETLPQQD